MLSPDQLQDAMELMTPEERQELHRLLALDAKLWKPTPGPQQMALESKADVLLYGGAAGGGKSDLMLGLAIYYHQQSIIYRRSMTQTKALITRAKKIVGDGGKNFKNDGAWYTLPDRDNLPTARFLRFGSVFSPGSEDTYQGNPFDFIGFDEGAHFTEQLFRDLMGWNRSDFEGHPDFPDFRCRVVVASNPPLNDTGDWMFDYWAPWLDPLYPKPALPGELRWFVICPVDDKDVEVETTDPFVWAVDEKGEKTKEPIYDFDPSKYAKKDIIRPKSRTFIPAKVEDNPYYANSSYMATLQNMKGVMRKKLLDGVFKKSTEENRQQVIPKAWVKAAMDRWKPRTKEELGPLDAVGVDVAMGGRDLTCLAKRYGNWIDRLISEPGTKTPDGATVADLLLSSIKDDDVSRGPYLNVDMNGVGHSVVGALNLFDVDNVHGVMTQSRSGLSDRTGMFKYGNLRAEIFWNMRELLDPDNGHDIALPPDPQLMADLCSATWRSKPNGIYVEEKSDIKKRLGRSIDFCDAVLLAFYEETSQVVARVSGRFGRRR